MSMSPRDEFARLDPDQQRRIVEYFQSQGGDLELLEKCWRGWKARPEQLAPPGDWAWWLLETGRGFGKTRSASEWYHERIELSPNGRGGLLHRTAADVRDVMIEGADGLLATAPPGKLPKYEPTKRRVTFYNGFMATCFSAEEPDQLRGPTLQTFWAEEFATYRALAGVDGLTAFDNARFALRGRVRGDRPRGIMTTTPKRVKSVKDVHKEAALPNSSIVVTKGSLLDNRHNLDPAYVAGILTKYAGTALGGQEIDGILATDVEGSLFKSSMFEAGRFRDLKDLPELGRPLVAVDPSVGDGTGDACGIVVVAVSAGTLPTEIKMPSGLSIIRDLRHAYVLEDATVQGPPEVWAVAVSQACERNGTTTVIAEVNQGHRLVSLVIRQVNKSLRVKPVHARQNKSLRAEPVAALFGQGRAHIVGEMPELEDECTTYVPAPNVDSPDRMDAMVYGVQAALPEASREVATHTYMDMSRNVVTGA